jgi:hypothetical protein
MWILVSWQLWPVYVLIVAAVAIPRRFRRTRFAELGGLGAIVVGVWLILPAPSLAA